jgi:hypothetical protein
VLICVSEQNDKLEMGGGTTKIFHVNQLRSYNERVETVASMVTANENAKLQ